MVVPRGLWRWAAHERALERLEYMLGPDHPEVSDHLARGFFITTTPLTSTPPTDSARLYEHSQRI